VSRSADDDSETNTVGAPWLTIGNLDRAESGIREIRVSKVAIDPVPVDGQVGVARFAKKSVDKLYLLHQPVAATRYSTSILATTVSPANGLPIVLATFEWSPRRFVINENTPEAPKIIGAKITVRPDKLPDGADPKPLLALRAMASVPTPLTWTRIGRDHRRWF